MAEIIPGETWATKRDALERLNQLLPGSGVIERPAEGYYRRGGTIYGLVQNEFGTWDLYDQIDEELELKPSEIAEKQAMIAAQQERVNYELDQLQSLQADLANIQARIVALGK